MHQADCNATCNQKITPRNHPLSVCVCVCVCVDVGVCVHFKESDNPPLSLISTVSRYQNCQEVTEHCERTGAVGFEMCYRANTPSSNRVSVLHSASVFCHTPSKSHTESPSCHMVIWMRLIVSGNGLRVCACVCFPGWLLLLYALVLFLPLLSSFPSLFFPESVISRTHGELSRGREGKGGMRNH